MPKIYFSDDDMCTTQKIQIAQVQDWFIANGWEVTSQPEDADKILCLTCNGWSLLTERSFDRIRKINDLKLDGEMVVFGCINDVLPDKVKEIHSGLTISNKHLLDQVELLIPDCEIKYQDVPPRSTFRTKEDYRVYNLKKKFVNIASGCSFNCSYCTHKPGLGSRRSRPLVDIIEQIKTFSQDDTDVVVLTGMETAYYGIDQGVTYPDMLKEVMSVSNHFDIHIAQFSPAGVHKYFDELVELFQDKRIKDIQIPIQSTCARILNMMNRTNNTEELGAFVDQVREKNKLAILRTDLIVGWPTETMKELEESLAYAVKYFDEIAAYAIEFSPELPAWKYKDKFYSQAELARRVVFAKEYIEKNGKMGHCGQQDDATMETVETKRETMRKERAEK